MKLLKLRLGSATNSSSSHSIVFGPNLSDFLVDDYQFGWDHFVAKSKRFKMMYFAVALWGSMRKKDRYNEDGIPSGEAQELIAKCYPELDDVLIEWRSYFTDDWSVYVDHQSRPNCPLYLNDRPNIDFYRAVTERFIFDDNIAIEGGNDNSGHDDLLLGRPVDIGVLEMLIDSSWRIRDEESGWVMINEHGGTKITLGREECIGQS